MFSTAQSLKSALQGLQFYGKKSYNTTETAVRDPSIILPCRRHKNTHLTVQIKKKQPHKITVNLQEHGKEVLANLERNKTYKAQMFRRIPEVTQAAN